MSENVHGEIFHISSAEEYNEVIARTEGNDIPVFIKFTAKWCGPCKAIEPLYVRLAQQFSKAIFLEVDVDAMSDLVMQLGITSMPTFWVIKNGQKVHEMKGADRRGLPGSTRGRRELHQRRRDHAGLDLAGTVRA